MKNYFVKTPWWLKKIFPKRVWSISTNEKVLFLSFDDGPHPEVTKFVLDELRKYNARASFFCIGKNVIAYPGLYDQIVNEGHTTGNHSYNHLNGWKTENKKYLADVEKAAAFINSNLFRPPYGRIHSSQVRKLKKFKIIMWDILSGDFDEGLSNEKCFANVINHALPGSIVVFHDSEKAYGKLKYVLPKLLEYYHSRGYVFEKIGGI